MNAFQVVSDLVCPWCYIGKRRLEAALREIPAANAPGVSWHPFQLNPDLPARGMDRKDYCRRKFGSWERCQEMFDQIASVGKTVGIDFHFDRQPIIPNTFESHRVIWFSGRHGVQDALVEALFRAYFCEGVDLSIGANLVEVGAGAGLDRKELEQFLRSDAGAAEVRSEEEQIKNLGISSVPLFIIYDRLAVSGAQPPEALVKAYEQAKAIRKPQKAPRGAATPNWTPGG